MSLIQLALVATTPQAFAHAPAPAGVGGGAGGSQTCDGFEVHRAGLGAVSTNEGQAASILRRQCTSQQRERDHRRACDAFATGNIVIPSLDDFLYNLPTDGRTTAAFQTGIQTAVHAYLKNYMAEVVQDEYYDVRSELIERGQDVGTALPPALSCAPRSAEIEPPHNNLRRVHRTTPQLASAAILASMYGMREESRYYFFSSTTPEYTPYIQRLQRNYPVLFAPTNRTQGLIQLLQQNMGDTFSADRTRSATYAETFRAFEDLYNENPDFSEAVEEQIDLAKSSYKSYLQGKLNGFCTRSLENLRNDFPAVFDQALLDMPPALRSMANLYLCQQPFYYQPQNYDTDCDGINDSSDTDPEDPYIPTSNFSLRGRAVENPPYGSDYDYNLSRNAEDNSLTVSTSLSFDLSELDETQRAAYIQRLGRCKTRLETSMQRSFEQLRGSVPWLDTNSSMVLDINFDTSSTPNPAASFDVHSCFCADCPNVLDPETGVLGFMQSYIPKTKCASELTQAQQQAIEAAVGGGATYDSVWRDRENAAHLTTNSNCHTIVHEVYHRLGLPDEYYDEETYPFNRTGCNIMGDGSTFMLESRQLDTILRPRRCQ